MSAINLYTTKTEALYFKDSQRNSFYEFGAIQLLPYNYYLQPYTYSNTITKVESFRLRDGVLLNDLSLYIQATVGYGIKFSRNTVMPYDYGNELIYLRFTHSGGYFYSNPFYYTALDEDKTSLIGYRDNFVDDLYFVSLKVWFRQKSRQSELTSYYETKTKNTVTHAIKSHNLDMYESEFMSMEDLIMTTDILESPYLAINGSVCSLFEAVKLPDLTQQENFSKIKFIINTIENPSIITNGLVLNLDAGNPLSYPGTGTLWTDLSGNNNNGTLVNSPTFNSANGGSIVFDGLNDYVNCGNASNLQITIGTLSVWVKTTTPGSSYRSIITKPQAWGLLVKDNILITYDWSLPLGTGTRTTGINISDSTWKNVVMTFTQTIGTPSNNVIIYLNGNPVLTTTVKHSNNNYAVQLASNSDGSTQFLNGNISEALIYNRVLSATEVLANFNATKGRYGL